MRHLPAFLGLIAVFALSVGCGREENLYEVSGTVTYNGKAVADGMIFFDPDPTNGTIGSQGFATIANGTYTTAKRGRGVRGGAYVIRISGFDGALANDDQPVRPLFEDYVVTRDIPTSATQLNFDVPASGKKDVRP